MLEFDPFADAFRRDPEGFYAPVREAGAVVFLERYGIWLLARFAEVRAALRDPERFCSAAGIGLTNFWQGEAVADAEPAAGGGPARAHSCPADHRTGDVSTDD
jgi:4-methoxybenzoate monooxygenase (O-demethylating)